MDDVISRFRPIEATRRKLAGDKEKKIEPDSDLLGEVLVTWIVWTAKLAFDADASRDRNGLFCMTAIPRGYETLTQILAWWIDQSPHDVDPQPITDCLRFAREVTLEARLERRGDAFDKLVDAFDRAGHVLNRIAYLVDVVEGGKPPRQDKRKPGRPPGSKSPDSQRATIERELGSDVFPEHIAKYYGFDPKYVRKIAKQLEANNEPK